MSGRGIRFQNTQAEHMIQQDRETCVSVYSRSTVCVHNRR